MRCVTFKELFKYTITNKTGDYDRINETSHHPQQANREECFHSPRLCFLFFLDFIVLWISLLEVFSGSASIFVSLNFCAFQQPHLAVISVLGAKVIPEIDGNARSRFLFSGKISNPAGRIFPKNLAFSTSFFLSARNSTLSALESALKQNGCESNGSNRIRSEGSPEFGKHANRRGVRISYKTEQWRKIERGRKDQAHPCCERQYLFQKCSTPARLAV